MNISKKYRCNPRKNIGEFMISDTFAQEGKK